jgi:hypothetical protein
VKVGFNVFDSTGGDDGLMVPIFGATLGLSDVILLLLLLAVGVRVVVMGRVGEGMDGFVTEVGVKDGTMMDVCWSDGAILGTLLLLILLLLVRLKRGVGMKVWLRRRTDGALDVVVLLRIGATVGRRAVKNGNNPDTGTVGRVAVGKVGTITTGEDGTNMDGVVGWIAIDGVAMDGTDGDCRLVTGLVILLELAELGGQLEGIVASVKLQTDDK